MANTVSETELGLLLMTELMQNVELCFGLDQRLSPRGVKVLPLFKLAPRGLMVSAEESEKLRKPNLLSDTSSSVSKDKLSSSSIEEVFDPFIRFFILFGVVYILDILTGLFFILLYISNTIDVVNS